MSQYDDIDEDVKITHKLASNYGWTWKQIWKETPYPKLKQLLKLIDMLENDQNAFLCPCEIASYKNLIRRYGKSS